MNACFCLEKDEKREDGKGLLLWRKPMFLLVWFGFLGMQILG